MASRCYTDISKLVIMCVCEHVPWDGLTSSAPHALCILGHINSAEVLCKMDRWTQYEFLLFLFQI